MGTEINLKRDNIVRRVFMRLGGTNTPHKTDEIIKQWETITGDKITSRKWREIKDSYNKAYRDNASDSYICGFSSGYVLTADNDLIRHDMAIKRRQALALLVRYSDTRQALALQRNYRADFDDIGSIQAAEGTKR